MADTIKTKIHTYRFDLRKPAEKAAWRELKARLIKTHPHIMESHGGVSHFQFVADLDGKEIELETKHLFDNQWNTAPIPGHTDKGLRVFDWALDASIGLIYPEWWRQGYYLDQIDEMREIRRNTMSCPYCGKQEPAAKGYVFCPHCLDSQYLTQADVLKGITRMRPIDRSGFGKNREELQPLTDAERDHLLPQFKQAQLHGTTERGKARIAKQRRDIADRLEKVTRHARAEHDGMLWLMDHGVNIDNVIYYSHTGRFGFGWRRPVDEAILSSLLDLITEFPFSYDIKTADGRTLSGER
jgi:hypothetical protein